MNLDWTKTMGVRSSDTPLQPEYADPVHAEQHVVPGARPVIEIVDVIETLRRAWRLSLIGFLIGLVVGLGYLVTVKIPYKSTARVLIDRSMNRYLQTNKLIDQPTLDDMEIGSQVYLFSSDSVISPVVRSLKLTSDGEFMPKPGHSVSMIGSSSGAESEKQLERVAAESVLKRLSVVREDVANVISVTFESQSPTKAAKIANAIADAYVANSLHARLNWTKTVTQWLQERLIELKRQAADADNALLEFRNANHLADDGIGTKNSNVVMNLKTQLANARIAVAEAKERLDRLKGASGQQITTMMEVDAQVNNSRSANINFAFNNSDLFRLRAEYRDAAARASEIEARVGLKHAASVKAREQLRRLRAAITAEERRISDAYVNEYKIAKAREDQLTATAVRLGGGTKITSQVRDLESAAETLHGLYDTFLQKYKEISASQVETLPVHTAHIISRAVPPRSKSSRKAMAIFAGCVMLGMFMGAGAAVGREWMADVLRDPKAVERVTEERCVVLPVIERKSGSLTEHVLAAPYSRFTESLREIKALIDMAPGRDGATVIGIVSSAPNEGKTVVATNLAALMAHLLDARTLVIDGDLHLRKLTRAFAPDAREGLIEALQDPSQLPRLVTNRLPSGAEFLPCVSKSRMAFAAELLGSSQMEQLLDAARMAYDYIIVEIPPIMSVMDARMIERFVDEFVFVVEWGRTKRKVVLDALSCSQGIRDRVVAVALNKVDPVALRRIDSYKGVTPGDYYRD